MRILVTGANGFVGGALVRRLALEHSVVAVDRTEAASPVAGSVHFEAGDFSDAQLLQRVLAQPLDAVVHLATVPGGAAEDNPAEAARVNVAGSMALIEAVARQDKPIRFIFASSIAALGKDLPDPVDDTTPLRPSMIYGAHKAMIEQWIATLSRRGAIEGLSLRLPGVLARPRGPSGLKSAFLSELFHAARAGEHFVCPVSPQATLWAMSRAQVIDNILVALMQPAAIIREPFALTLPALHVTMAAMVAALARRLGRDLDVTYQPDPALEAMFGAYPPLSAQHAEAAGFTPDPSLDAFVARALDGIA